MQFVARIALALVALCALVSCSDDRIDAGNVDYGFSVEDVPVNGPGTVGLSMSGQPVKGLVVYFHGLDQTARVIRDDEKHRNLFDPMLRAGYAVVAADAGGNAFGNPRSVGSYRRLIAAARQKYGAGPLFFVTESMGTLAALTLISEDADRQVKAMVAVSPLMGLPPQAREVKYIAGPWGGTVPPSADPMTWPPSAFANRAFRLYLPTGDTVVPSGGTGKDFAARFGSVAGVEIVECQGGHVASVCYQGDDVEKWIAARG
ncbi:alpha/beta hydrolase [Mycobacterium sp. URHB0044]|uniref:alpha/beta hydrolase n=1 Tax=Mycobacterium sp. URHB0044 TaxID=1380386 RepID=UPI00048F6905|nr:alpha/beta fold hydrolase [Mycobacterium sp. URHB0044]